MESGTHSKQRSKRGKQLTMADVEDGVDESKDGITVGIGVCDAISLVRDVVEVAT